MENAIVVVEEEKKVIDLPVNATEYGVTDTTAAAIAQKFVPMLYEMTQMEQEFNAIMSLPKEDKETVKKSRELRLRYVKVRGKVDKEHKAGKVEVLNIGRVWDAWKNTQLAAASKKEEKLEAIEKHAENLERERLEKLQSLRVALLAEYVENASELSLSGMEQDVFDAYLSTKKQQYEDRKAAELKAEQDRIAREKAEAEEREAQRLENIRLKEEADKREAGIEAERIERDRIEAEKEAVRAKRNEELRPYIVFIRDYNGTLNLDEDDYQKELSGLEIVAKQQWDYDNEQRRIAQEKADKDAAELAEKQKEIDRIEKELADKKAAEAKAENDRIAAEKAAKLEAEKLAKAPIKAQLTAWVNSFAIPVANIEHEKKVLIEEKFNRFLEWAKSEINNI